jgi:hypothetical protein
MLGEIDANFMYTGLSVFDNSDILVDRPYGSCAILWRSVLVCKAGILSTNSMRVYALYV